MQRSDARKREATPSEMWALTEAERAAVNAAACGNCGERTAVLNLVARIKAEAVQAERERIAREIQSRAVPPLPDNTHEQRLVGDAYRNAARIARGEGR